MPFLRSFRKSSQPSLARTVPADGGGDSDDAPQRRVTEPIPTTSHSWRKKTVSTVNRPTSPPQLPMSTLPFTRSPESPAPDSEVGVLEQSMPMPLPTTPFVTNLALVPRPEAMTTMPNTGPVPVNLSEAWDIVKDGPKGSDMSRTLNAIDDVVSTAQGNGALFEPLITAVESAVEQTDLGKDVENFFEAMPIFMNALDAVADLHPFIGVVVLAFKTVYTLEMKRRDNEKKIIALYVEMKDMMSILLLLRDVQNDKLIAPDGRSIKDRISSLVERTAADIKLCSNVCNAFAKKRLLAKVIKGPIWDGKLLGWVALFSKRREEFKLELSIHTSQGVDKANAKLDDIGEKMNAMILMFQQLVSPEQKSLTEQVAAIGGVKALRNNDNLMMLLSLDKTGSNSHAPSAPKSEGRRMPRAKPSDANMSSDDLRKDIFEDPDAAVDQNQILFFRRFELKKHQIIDELKLAITRESDRIIQVVRGGPHERILDRSIHEIWKDMGWRGNVKARHFVLAFRDYYVEKFTSEGQGVRGMSTTAISTSRDPDAWAIKFIDVARLQPILEAFDDDASGFITITEVNRFTSSRPVGWSLPHWIAFWAVGYRASIIDYADKIEELFAKMEGVRAEVLPPNRGSIDEYLNFSWPTIHALTAAVTSLQPESGPPASTWDKFKSYRDAEEARLSTNLKAVDYVIDGADTLALITGEGRIEKTLFPLIYLLMKHHYEIMRAMRAKVLDVLELECGAESLFYVNDTIRYRMDDLTNIFFQHKLDPKKQFQNFAYGIFKYLHNPKDLWSLNYVRTLNPQVTSYNDANEDQKVRLEDILNHEYKDELPLNDWVYDGHSIDYTPDNRNVELPLKDILGQWHGYFYWDGGSRESTMKTLVLEPADGDHGFKGNGWSDSGRHAITGSWFKGENDVMKVKFKMTYQIKSSLVFFDGRFDAERDALTGFWGLSAAEAETESGSSGRMEFRRIPPLYLTVYPSIKELSDDKSRALWRFAIAAVRNDVRRERWSWTYFAQRRDDRETVLSLGIRYLHFGKPLGGDETQRFLGASQRLTSADACFYNSKIDRIRANTWVHRGVGCDNCRGIIGGARLICLDCDQKDTAIFSSIDLCCAQECMAARITSRFDLAVPHEPYHRLVKLRTAILQRQYGHVYTAALKAFVHVREICVNIAEASQGLVEKDEDGEVTGPDTEIPPRAELTPKGTPPEPDEGQPDDAPDDTMVDSEAKGDEGTTSDQNPQDRTRPQDSDLPSCGNSKCKGPSRLSFPFWYCIYCKDNLFLCDSCDREGDPELMQSSRKHSEYHHLIRCLAPEDDNSAYSTEQRLTSLEDRLTSMQSKMQSQYDDLTGRIKNIEQLLHRLATASEAPRS